MDNPKAYEIDVFFNNNTASFRNSLFKCFVSRYGVGLKTQTNLSPMIPIELLMKTAMLAAWHIERKIH